MSAEKDFTNLQDRPLQMALVAAVAACEAAYAGCDCQPPEEERCRHYDTMVAADAAVEAARDALRDSDEPRAWILREEGADYDTVMASSLKEALDQARLNVDRTNYPEADHRIWIDISARCMETDDRASDAVTLDQHEPECEDGGGKHDWQSPHELVGGAEDNPGVWGHGSGEIIDEVCMRCGCERSTDTWAQNPETGEHGFASVSYAIGKYAHEVARD
jgi:hypothetical protein